MPATKQLLRLPDEGKIAGICAGLADYFEVDVTLVRVIVVVIVLATGGAGFLGYIVLWATLPTPDKPTVKPATKAASAGKSKSVVSEAPAAKPKPASQRGSLSNIFGLGLIALGAWLLIAQFFPDFWLVDWRFIWPSLLVMLGLLLISKSRR